MNATDSLKTKQKSKFLGTALRFLLLASLTFLALFYVLKDHPGETFSKLLSINLLPFLLCLSLVLFLNVLDGFAITLLARIYRKNYSFSDGFKCSLIFACFSSFNKAGGHLFQAITLVRQDVEGYHAASIVTMNFLMYQLTLTIYSLFMVFVGYPYVKDTPLHLLGDFPVFYLSLLALLFDFLFLLVLVFLSGSKVFHRFMVQVGVFFIHLFHLKKDPEMARKEWVMKITTYRIEFRRLLEHKKLVFLLFLVSVLRQIVTNSIPFFCLWCMGVDVFRVGYLSLLSGASYLNLITTVIPAGAPEVCFQSIFSYLVNPVQSDASFVSSSNLLWRFLTFYIPVLVGGFVFFIRKPHKESSLLPADDLTMYDLQVCNYENTTIMKNGISQKDEFLSDKEIERSVFKMKRYLSRIKKKKPETYYDRTITLTIQKQQLSEVLRETELLEKMNHENFSEIQKEIEKEEDLLSLQKQKREAKKAKRKSMMTQRKLAKEKRILEKLQPVKTTITFDDKYGIDLGKDAFIVSQSHTSYDESEIDHSLDGDDKKGGL